jgi:hypothetical protein
VSFFRADSNCLHFKVYSLQWKPETKACPRTWT